MESIEKYIMDNYINKILAEENGEKYILESDLEKISSNDNERRFIISILQKNNIGVKAELIKKEDRPNFVKDYDYGEVQSYDLDYLDEPVYAKIEFDKVGNIIYEDYSELEDYLSKEFIPNNVYSKRYYDEKEMQEKFRRTVQLGQLLKLGLSELENTYAIIFLKEQGIIVRGYRESVSELDNYEFARTYKNVKLADFIGTDEMKDKFIEYTFNKDSNLRKELIEGNMRLAKWIAYKYSIFTDITIEELESYAYEGLCIAVDGYDILKGYEFSSYAYKVIDGIIKNNLPDYYNMDKNSFSDFIKAKEIIEEAEGKTLEEHPDLIIYIAEFLYQTGKISETKMKNIIARFHVAGLDNFEEMNEDYLPEDLIVEDIDVEINQKALNESLQEVLLTLTPREAKVISLRFGLEDGIYKTLDEVAATIRVPRERIRQIEAKALRKLRHPVRAKRLKDYDFEPRTSFRK